MLLIVPKFETKDSTDVACSLYPFLSQHLVLALRPRVAYVDANIQENNQIFQRLRWQKIDPSLG